MKRRERPRIANDVTELIGYTPLVRLQKIDSDLPGNIIGKLEYFNPCSSVKDRIGFSMIDEAGDSLMGVRLQSREQRDLRVLASAAAFAQTAQMIACCDRVRMCRRQGRKRRRQWLTRRFVLAAAEGRL